MCLQSNAYIDAKVLMDEKKAQEYFKNPDNNFSNSISKRM